MRIHCSPSRVGPLARAVAGFLLVASWPAPRAAFAADPAAPAKSVPTLNLASGGFFVGEIVDCDRPNTVRWRSQAFSEPLDFPTGVIAAAQWPIPAQVTKPEGLFTFELTGGDLLFGSLLELGERDAVLDVARFGRLHVDRSLIHRIERIRNHADLIYSGPTGLIGWKDASLKPSWREEAGRPLADQEGAILFGDLGLPGRAAVEVELSWKNKPDFILALGVNSEEAASRNAFRLEVWEGQLVAHRETETEADVISLMPIDTGPGRVHLTIYLDQQVGRMLIFSSAGKMLADMKVASRKPKPLGGVRLANLKNDIRLERLRISRWDGESPREAAEDRARIQLEDGSVLYGNVTGYDPASKEFVVDDKGQETRVSQDKIVCLFLSQPKDTLAGSIRTFFHDGTRISGDLIKIQDGAIWLNMAGVKETPHAPLDGIRSIVSMHPEPPATAKDVDQGKLESDGLSLPGHLAAGEERPAPGTLLFLPQGSTTPAALRPGVAAKLVYREPTPPPPPPQNHAMTRVVQAPAPAGLMGGIFRAWTNAPQGGPVTGPSRRALHLRTGDIIPCEVTKIDESGVTFKSKLTEATFVPHEKIKAVELLQETPSTVRLNKAKRERLLTLPRLQKENPPTHMIRSRDGDYLRGRLIGMDDTTIKFEVHLETKNIPRDRVTRMIWLHEDEIDPSKKTARAPEADARMLVQAIRSDGIRMTFAADHVEDGTIHGKSDVMGGCRVRLEDVDRLVLNGAIEQEAADLAYGRWKLQNAPEPKVAQDDNPEGRDSGTESPLVGKPAPDFTLETLDGKKFRLANARGEVIVLDFWATWCGPCLQAMPQVDRATREFADQGVRLIAVNLEESPKEISSMLQRHKLDVKVALDRDGVVAGRYAANAIPQTVIIDRQGNVARLFIGGGPNLEDQIRSAIKTLLPEAKPKVVE